MLKHSNRQQERALTGLSVATAEVGYVIENEKCMMFPISNGRVKNNVNQIN